MASQQRVDHLALRAAAIPFAALALLSATIAVSAPPRGGGDVFSASRTAPAQTDAAACRDPQIARIEQETGTQARVFDYRASGTMSGRLGGSLQDRGLVEQTGVCLSKPNALVMFIDNRNIADVDNVTNEYFAASASGGSPAGSNTGGSDGGGRSTGQGDANPDLARHDDCSKGAPGAYDPSQNPRCQTPYRRSARTPTPSPDGTLATRRHDYGAKGVGRNPQGQNSPDQPASLPIGFENIAQGIDACFKQYLPRYKSPDWKLYPKEALDPQSDRVFERAFVAAQYGAEQAVRSIGPLRNEGARFERGVDYLTGWVTGCLEEREILPMRGLRDAYRQWADVRYPSATDEEKMENEQQFRIGYGNRLQRPFDD